MIRTYLLVLVIGLQVALGFQFGPELLKNSSKTATDNKQFAVNDLKAEAISSEQKPAASKIAFLDKLKDKGITLHPGSEFTSSDKPTPMAKEHCAELVYRTLEVMPADVSGKLKNLTLYFSSTGRRGLGGGSTIILRCQNVSDTELVGVLVHELGHIKDTGLMKGDFWSGESEFKDGEKAIYENDPSLKFYRIGFENEKKVKEGLTADDFVTGYAMTDPFEDFAETYNFYVLHGKQFEKMAQSNTLLSQKYQFMKEEVFEGKEFKNVEDKDFNGDLGKLLIANRNYDSTLIEFNLKEFLAI